MQPLYEYVCHIKGHRNSKGELAEWVIKSHTTGKILSSHKSEKKAKEHLQQMHIFKESVDSMGYKLIGETTNGNTMDKRFNIFMENVAKLGLSKNQFEAVGNITKVCLEASFGELQEPDVDEMGDVYTSQEKSSHLTKRSNVSYADFLKMRDEMEPYGDVGSIKKYHMPLIDTNTNEAQFVNYDSIPEDTDGNSWGFGFGYNDGFNYVSSKYIWLPKGAFDTPTSNGPSEDDAIEF